MYSLKKIHVQNASIIRFERLADELKAVFLSCVWVRNVPFYFSDYQTACTAVSIKERYKKMLHEKPLHMVNSREVNSGGCSTKNTAAQRALNSKDT